MIDEADTFIIAVICIAIGYVAGLMTKIAWWLAHVAHYKRKNRRLSDQLMKAYGFQPVGKNK